ncbi:MAG TPA: hypothetical protein VF532_09050 [Candidatus Angelobacter sp.]
MVSHLVVRHIIQVIPAAIAAIFVAKGGRAGRYAALPIFVSWLLIMLAIWLFLLGIARIVSGTFTPAEIALTVVIGVCSLWGVVVVLRQPRAPLLLAIIYFVGFAALQFLGLRISLLPAFVRR